jgi:hypothetical protein
LVAHFPIVITKLMPQNQKLRLIPLCIPPIVSGNIKIHSSSLKLCPSRYHSQISHMATIPLDIPPNHLLNGCSSISIMHFC